MSSIDIVIANALVPADFVADLLRDMALPGFDLLAAQGSATEEAIPHDSLLPAWQAWPYRHLDVPNVALGWSRHFDVAIRPGRLRYLAQPVHFDIGTHGLALEAPDSISLSEPEARQLQSELVQSLSERGVSFAGGDSRNWLLDFEPDFELLAAVPELALHQDVLPWLPQGPAKRTWHQLSNQLQMQMHQHPLNDHRAEAGLATVSGLWLSGTGATADGAPLPYRKISGMPAWLDAWWQDPESAAELLGLTSLTGPSSSEDWSGFRNALIGIDEQLLRQLHALRAGEVGALRVVLTGDRFAREVIIKRADLYKFWRRGKAEELFDLPA